MPKVPFKFAIVNASLQYYQVVGQSVSISISPVYLAKSIVDWDTLTLSYKRDSTYWGVIRSYSPQRVRFVNNGAEILRYIKNSQGGIEAIAYLGVYLLQQNGQYQLLDYWQLDFSQTSNQLNYFECALMDGGLSAILKAYGSTNYNIPLNDPALAPNYPVYNPLPSDQIELAPPLNPATNANIPTPKLFFIDGIPIMGEFQFATNTMGEGLTLPEQENDPSWGGLELGIPGLPFYTAQPSFGLFGGSTAAGTPVFTLGLANSVSFGDYNGSLGTVNTPIYDQLAGPGHSYIAQTVLFTAAPNITGIPSSAPIINISYNMFFYANLANIDTGSKVKIKLMYQVFNCVNPANPNAWTTQDGNNHLLTDSGWIEWAGVGQLNQITFNGSAPSFTMTPGQMLVVGLSYELQDGGTLSEANQIGIKFAAYNPAATYPTPAITLTGSFVPPSSVCRAISHNDLFNFLRYQMATNGGLLTNADGTPQIPYASKSTLLSTPIDPNTNYDLNPTDTWFTCADSLRGLNSVTIQDPLYNGGNPFTCYIVPAIYTNMQDFARDLMAELCASIGIEKTQIGTDTLVAEKLSYFLDDTKVIVDLGTDIDDFEMEDLNDYKGSSVNIGQNDQQFDSLNGPLETNSVVTWALPITRIQKVVDLTTPYRCEALGIEETRANVGNKTNVNSSSDNDTFKLQADGNGVSEVPDLDNYYGVSGNGSYISIVEALKLKRPLTTPSGISQGLPDTELTPAVNPYGWYNLSFTPQRKALRLAPWLCSNYYGLLGKFMAMSGYKKNVKLVSNLGAGVITELNWINLTDTQSVTYVPPYSLASITIPKQPIPAGKTTIKLFQPYIFNLTSKVPVDLTTAMTPPGTPGEGAGLMYGKVKFTFTRNGQQFQLAGFPLDIGITPGTQKAYKYRLLCSPTCIIPNNL